MNRFNFAVSLLDGILVICFLIIVLLSGCGSGGSSRSSVEAARELSDIAALGQQIYFDENLSDPVGQSCASCHLPSAGFADPDANFPVSEGAVDGRFGARNTPTASYAAFIPAFGFVLDRAGGHYRGGQFWDGRASTLELQAQGPFLSQLEMNMADNSAVIDAIRKADYATDFGSVFGDAALDDVDRAYEQVAAAIAAFERSGEFAPFDSRFDAVVAGADVFTPAEQNGRALFNGRANCNRCHSSGRGPDQVFSDFGYHNIGVPANPDNPFLTLPLALNPDGNSFVDKGLGAVLDETDQNGKFKTPTLRNAALTAPYMHNGVFDTLEEVVEFYNRRDVDGVVPEVEQNVDNTGNIGNLNLTPGEIRDLVAFLQTLSDGYQ